MAFKIVFMGTPDFSIPALENLHRSDHIIQAVYCQPARPKNRGQKIQLNPVHAYAENAGIEVFAPDRLRKNEQEIERLKAFNPDIIVVVAYGMILPKDILSIPKFGCINIHASLLPRWRGAAPIFRAMLAGDKVAGITTMLMDEGLDTGAMLQQGSILITPSHTIQALHDQLSDLGAQLILQTLDNLDSIDPVSQPAEGITYAEKITKDEGNICWEEDATQIVRKISVLNPWPGTYSYLNGEMLKIHQAEVVSMDGSAGQVLQCTKDKLIIGCGKDAILVKIIQRPRSKLLHVRDFLNGFSIHTGATFTSCSDIN